ncbi:MAG: hypothetical protein Fur0024_5320 [Patescibacteria group bacterium]
MLKKEEKLLKSKSTKLMKFLGSDLFFNVLLGIFAVMILATGTFVMYLYGKENWWKEVHPISRKSESNIVLQLDPVAAPKTVENFLKKVDEKYFDGLKFHRVEDWVVQGGDPLSRDNDPSNDGTGGGEIPTEISSKSFIRGAVGVARGGDKAISNDSQFFITKTDSTFLDGEYTYFGRVLAGMDLVDSIKIGDVIEKIERGDVENTVRIYLAKDEKVLTTETN